MPALSLGVDFDNTLVCYDEVFHRLAVEQALVPAEVARTKESVRDHLRAAGREDDWTELQGLVYGRRLREAPPFAGALAFLGEAVRRGVPVSIISHKTRRPYRGPDADLHAAARDWLEFHGCFDAARVGLRPEQVTFLETKAEKLARIGAAGCSHFIDDLPEILLAEGFPPATRPILFAPGGQPAAGGAAALTCLRSWAEVRTYFAWLWEEAA
jgi:hypothetical protein